MRRNNEQRIRRNMIQFGTFAVLGGLASFALGTANHSLQPLPEFDPAALARSCRESLDRYGQDFTASQNLRIQSEDPQIPDSLVPCPSPPCKGETVLPLSYCKLVMDPTQSKARQHWALAAGLSRKEAMGGANDASPVLLEGFHSLGSLTEYTKRAVERSPRALREDREKFPHLRAAGENLKSTCDELADTTMSSLAEMGVLDLLRESLINWELLPSLTSEDLDRCMVRTIEDALCETDPVENRALCREEDRMYATWLRQQKRHGLEKLTKKKVAMVQKAEI